MQTNLADFLRNTPEGEEAKSIVGNCVHCGFCTATCPTYQLLGDELDAAARAHLPDEAGAGRPCHHRTHAPAPGPLPDLPQLRIDLPSGVRYGRLVDIGRKLVDDKLEAEGVRRPASERIARWCCARG